MSSVRVSNGTPLAEVLGVDGHRQVVVFDLDGRLLFRGVTRAWTRSDRETEVVYEVTGIRDGDDSAFLRWGEFGEY